MAAPAGAGTACAVHAVPFHAPAISPVPDAPTASQEPAVVHEIASRAPLGGAARFAQAVPFQLSTSGTVTPEVLW